MNHFIWITAMNDQTMYLLATQVQSFVRANEGGVTLINLSSGACLATKTTPEELERRMNNYMNEMLLFLHKK